MCGNILKIRLNDIEFKQKCNASIKTDIIVRFPRCELILTVKTSRHFFFSRTLSVYELVFNEPHWPYRQSRGNILTPFFVL